MPLYDYKCREHGLFQELGAMAEAGNPAHCP
ncbi:MAG TPA: formamidase, partial [Marinobacter hydrocarbonoclasticus]|nr:formamidase [Marinobacter nauticus]